MIQQCPHCRRAVTVRDDGRCPACGEAAFEPGMPVIHAEPLAEKARRAAAEEEGGYGIPAAPARDELNFYRNLVEATPRVFITQLLIAANVLVFLAMFATGDNPLAPTVGGLIRWGGNFGPLTLGGQWWRLFTCMFLHAGLLHIGFNMWILWDIGQFVERMLGNLGFLLLYVACGLFGSLASLWWNSEARVSVGASGAVFGCFGMLLGFLLVQRRSLPRGMFAQLSRSGLVFLGYNVIFGLMVPGIDNAAHFGGLAAGFLGGLVAGNSLTGNVMLTRAVRNTAVLILAAAGVLAGAWLLPKESIRWIEAYDRATEIDNAAFTNYQRLLNEGQAGRLSDERLAERLQTEVLPSWREAAELLQGVDRAQVPNQERHTLLLEYMRDRAASVEMLVDALKLHDDAKMAEHQRLWEEANRKVDRFNKELQGPGGLPD